MTNIELTIKADNKLKDKLINFIKENLNCEIITCKESFTNEGWISKITMKGKE